VLGSRSTDTLSGLGPPVLAAGQELPVGTAAAGDPGDFGAAAGSPAGVPALRLAPGPRADWFAPESLDRLYGMDWQVLADSNRIGVRLGGTALRLGGTALRLRPDTEQAAAELPSEPTLPGAVQAPPDGQPIVLGPDAPVTGGYPVIGVLPGPELDLLAQLRPGARLRFVPAPAGPGHFWG
jgi:allophanate hydrolase subunit 2